MRYPTARKTVDVVHLIVSFNRAIAKAKTRDERKAFCFAIETVLHNSGNYAGYGYLFDFAALSEAERSERDYERSYFFSDTVRAAYRTAYQWCADCKEFHVIDPDATQQCSW